MIPAGVISAESRKKPALPVIIVLLAMLFQASHAQQLDVLIDGNGDGVYGSPGSGAGGFSTKRIPSPGTGQFILEIQNQGSKKNKYWIIWNTIPPFVATVNGSTSPFQTPNINAGESAFYTFEVQAPAGVVPGDYSYIIDVRAVKYKVKYTESVEARVTVPQNPRVDLVIDGDGLGVFAPAGSGDGGRSLMPGNPGSSYSSTLRVRNAGESPDSFFVWWEVPPGWPQGSVVLKKDGGVFTSQVVTSVLAPGEFEDYEVEVQVPFGLSSGLFTSIINTRSFKQPRSEDSARLVTQTGAVIAGTVFDDKDHNSTFSTGDEGLGGVLVQGGGEAAAVTDALGNFSMIVPGGSSIYIIERNPSGYISLSPDTLGPLAVGAGDTILVSFADVPPPSLSPGVVLNGLAGSYVDFPHSLAAGTRGQAALQPSGGDGAVMMLLLDANGNGIFDNGDRTLRNEDLDMDPETGHGRVDFLLRIFIPAQKQPGETLRIRIEATQIVEGTPYSFVVDANDAAVVVGSAIGRLALSKEADKATAVPGDVITYTISYFNAGTDTLQNVVLLDPVSSYVDVLADGFGAGMDVQWNRDGQPVRYLTIDPSDSDECEYSSSENLMRIICSKITPFLIPPGEKGSIIYKVRVK